MGNIFDLAWGATQLIANKNTFGLVPLTGSFTRSPVNNVTPTAFSDKATMVKKQLTTAQTNAINQAVQLKYGMAVVTNPSNVKMITTLRTIATINTLKKSGLELAPKGTTTALYGAETAATAFQVGYNALSLQNEAMLNKQQAMLTQISSSETTLAKATNELGVTKGQLELTTSRYEDLVSKYNALVANPSGGGGTIEFPDILGGLGDAIKKYGIWIALGVGAVILLPSILRSRE